MRVLVTGGFGYIGGRFVEWCVDNARFQVRVLTRRVPPGLRGLAEGVDVWQADVTRLDSLAGACEGIDAVVHLASLDERECAQAPTEALRVNAEGTHHVLQEAVRAGVKRFVYFSTLRVYGDALSGTVDETMVPAPTHAYGITHLAAEEHVRRAALAPGMKAFSVRLTNAVGAPVSGDVNRWSLVANDLCRQAVTDGKIVLRSSGLQHRDFIPMTAVLDAIALLVTAPDDALAHEVYNLGVGVSTSILTLARAVQGCSLEAYGVEPPLEAAKPAPTEREEPLKVDISRVRALGFNPNEDLKPELRRTLDLCRREFAAAAQPEQRDVTTGSSRG